MNILVNMLGWIGTGLIVGAYYLVSNKKLDAAGRSYQLINLAGSACMGINVFYNKAWPAVTLQIAWAAIAILALVKNK